VSVHIEVLVEDSSGKKLLEILIPKIIGRQGEPHTWRIHSYKGAGHIPPKLNAKGDPSRRILLDRLPGILAGYGRTGGIDAVVVVLDADRRNCRDFLSNLKSLLDGCRQPPKRTLFRLAIEEMEAWYLGDREALVRAFPRIKANVLKPYTQDEVCGAWEILADAVHPGGSLAVKKAGGPSPGRIKHEWAGKIGPFLDPGRNVSPSFCKFRDGLVRLAGER